MPADTSLYDLLGVSPDANEDEVKKAYRKKAREHHPDKNPDDPEASQKFQEMLAAYEILSVTETREAYDRYGLEGVSGRGGSEEMDHTAAAEMFAEMFGQGMHFGFDFGQGSGFGFGGPRRRSKGEDSVIPYEVTLEDLYNGKSVKMNMEKEVVCSVCKGSGARGSAKPKQCAMCDGKGWTVTQTQISPNRYATSRVTCSDCHGHGEKLREKDRCKKCKGNKTVKEKTRQEIFVERGMTDRQRIVLAGAGDEEPGIPPGDVVFVLKARHHESFERSGNDLLTTVHITLSEALLGFSRILVTHLDGRGLRVSSTAGKIVKPGDSIVIRGEGMPAYKNPDQKGNLYVMLQVDMPDEAWLSHVDRTALTALLPPHKPEMDPLPEVVDEVPFETSDLGDVRDPPFSAGAHFFDHHPSFGFGFGAQFGDDDDDDDPAGEWVDEDDGDGEGMDGAECRHQ